MSIRGWLMAKLYDRAMGALEHSCLGRWRSDLLCQAWGDVLEVGSGTGANLIHYPDGLTSLVLTEPDPHMLGRLRINLKAHQGGKFQPLGCGAEALSFSDGSFDCVVATLVLCSVSSPSEALRELHRVLRPGGRLLFIEHVAAQGCPRTLRMQRLLQPLWKRLCCNCHLARDTQEAMVQAGFEFETLERVQFRGVPAFVSPVIKGVAQKGD